MRVRAEDAITLVYWRCWTCAYHVRNVHAMVMVIRAMSMGKSGLIPLGSLESGHALSAEIWICPPLIVEEGRMMAAVVVVVVAVL